MDWYVLVLRVLHIGAGIFWVGAAFTFFAFIEPTAGELGPDSQKFMDGIVNKRRFPIVIMMASGLTIVAGLLLYLRDSGGLRAEWITSGTGLTFTIGGLAAIIAFLIGLLVIKPSVERLGVLGSGIAQAGRAPTEAELTELHAIEGRMKLSGRIDIVLLAVAALAMATARYIG